MGLYILLGFIVGILFAAIILFLYSNFSKQNDAETTLEQENHAEVIANQDQTEAHSAITAQNNEHNAAKEFDDEAFAPINDKEFGKLFKPSKEPKPIQDIQPKDPFENAFGNKPKPVLPHEKAASKPNSPAIPVTLQKAPVKATTNKSELAKAVATTSKPNDKTQDIEVPQATVQISVTRTPKEN